VVAEIDLQDELYHAVEHVDGVELRRLLDAGVTVAGSHALPHALDYDNTANVRALLERGADPNERYPGDPTVRGDTPLHHAVLRGRAPEFVSLLTEFGAEVDAVDDGGLTPYAMAVRLGRVDVAARLVELGASVDIEDVDRFYAACWAGDLDEARRLRPAEYQERDRFVFHVAAQEGNVVAIRTMLAVGMGPDVRRAYDDGTALHHAAWNGHLDVVDALLNAGADVDAQARWGIPLDWARADNGARNPDVIARLEALSRSR
jgi:ankyrin repeat protein